ncbi:MAG: alanine--tRNA ligase, partial [Patescibacteria group bacterium]
IAWSYDFLTSPKYLGFNPEELWVSVFAGENGIPRDEESADVWKSLGIPSDRVLYYPRADNFWGPVGETGPCGPDTEIFVDTGKPAHGPDCKPGCGCGKYFEVWNNVFMEYERTEEGKYIPLKQKNVDTGMGVERTVAMLNSAATVYEIDTLEPLVKQVSQYAKRGADPRSVHIIIDHIRAVVFLLADERQVRPSNVDQGYVLRRLIRRMIRHAKLVEMDLSVFDSLVQSIVHEYHLDYPELVRNREVILDELHKETDKFLKTLEQGMKQFAKFEKNGFVTGANASTLFMSHGFPLEMTTELAHERGIEVRDIDDFYSDLKSHQEKSRTAAAGKFKGGLADHGETTTKYHTANHMMLEALKRVLGRDEIHQKGSNITSERLRFDFTFPRKMTPEEMKQVEDIVNTEIKKDHDVHFEEMSVDKAKTIGATGVFEHKYGDTVKVYFVGDYSTEICGGPHVKNTKGMGRLKIQKEEASSAGVRRIKAILEQ